MKLALWTSAALVAFLPAVSQAVQVTAQYTPLGGANWQVDLILSNDDTSFRSASNPGGLIAEFTVFFPFATHSGLESLGAPPTWDPLVIQPDSSPSDGYVDYLVNAGAAPLAIGQSLSGLSVGFSISGVTEPGALRYTVVDPDTFATLFQGQAVVVPEPATTVLWLLGLSALGWCQVARRNAKEVC